MKSSTMLRLWSIFFVLGFFLYLFGPLILMSVTAFNSSAFPRVTPWDCFSAEWFDTLRQDERLMLGLRNSVVIGFGVVCLSVPIGLAGSLMLTQVSSRLRPWYYTIVISPILIPGVVLGISTLIFWERIRQMLGLSADTFMSDGIFLTIIGQSTFISAYVMLVFISRLQRFDPVLEEAALDLGATHVQTFRKILLPFLKPAIASGAVLAFLASFENYNTTVFTALSDSTLTTVLASKVRYGIDPSISALAVIIVSLTLIGAVVYEIAKRRELARESLPSDSEKPARLARPLFVDPAFLVMVCIVVAGLGTIYFAGTIGVDECKVAVKEQKRLEAQRRIEQLQKRQIFQNTFQSVPTNASGSSDSEAVPKIEAKGTENFQNLFAPDNLEGQIGSSAPEPVKGTENFQNIFAPDNLEGQADRADSESQ